MGHLQALQRTNLSGDPKNIAKSLSMMQACSSVCSVPSTEQSQVSNAVWAPLLSTSATFLLVILSSARKKSVGSPLAGLYTFSDLF